MGVVTRLGLLCLGLALGCARGLEPPGCKVRVLQGGDSGWRGAESDYAISDRVIGQRALSGMAGVLTTTSGLASLGGGGRVAFGVGGVFSASPHGIQFWCARASRKAYIDASRRITSLVSCKRLTEVSSCIAYMSQRVSCDRSLETGVPCSAHGSAMTRRRAVRMRHGPWPWRAALSARPPRTALSPRPALS